MKIDDLLNNYVHSQEQAIKNFPASEKMRRTKIAGATEFAEELLRNIEQCQQSQNEPESVEVTTCFTAEITTISNIQKDLFESMQLADEEITANALKGVLKADDVRITSLKYFVRECDGNEQI